MKTLLAQRLKSLVGMLAGIAALLALNSCFRGPTESLGRPWDKIQLEVKDKTLEVEVASDNPSRQLGLMNRKELPKNHGMLFLYSAPSRQGFWMKNTFIDLSIAFLGDDGKILEIHDMKAHDERHTQSNNFVRYALEVNRGWFQEHGIAVGDSFKDFQMKIGKFVVR